MTDIEAYHDPHPHRTGQTGETAPLNGTVRLTGIRGASAV